MSLTILRRSERKETKTGAARVNSVTTAKESRLVARTTVLAEGVVRTRRTCSRGCGSEVPSMEERENPWVKPPMPLESSSVGELRAE
jgi:ribosomal protein L14